MEVLRAPPFSNLGQSLPEFWIGRRAGKERLSKGSKIKSGPAYENRSSAPAFNFPDLLQSVLRPLPGCVGRFGWGHVNQVMRNAPHLFRGYLCCGDSDPLVNLYRIAINDLAIQSKGNFNTQRAFTRGRRTHYRNNVFQRVYFRTHVLLTK
jgi:hypothetical protein